MHVVGNHQHGKASGFGGVQDTANDILNST
jgi:hypothetical protein